jgi:sugar phosphate isomerase/epimerase
MGREFMCSSHTISGVMPGGPRASRHPLGVRLAACPAAGYSGYWLHWRDYLEQRSAGMEDRAIGDLFDACAMHHRGVEFLTDWFLDGNPAARDMEAAAFAAAAAIGATTINVGADFLGRRIPRREMVASFGALCRRAADRGLSIALEIVPWSDVPDIAAALDFLESANAGVVLDAWHVFRGGIPLTEIARIPPGRILCVQVNDADLESVGPLPEDTMRRKPCGSGSFDLEGFAGALDRAGARVPYSVEIISPDCAALSADEAARVSIECARRVLRCG